MKLKTILVPALFLLCMATAGFIVAKVHRPQNRPGCTLQITHTVYPANGSPPFLESTSVRYQKSDGSWRNETTYANGRVAVGFAQPGRGVFHVDEKNQKLEYLSGSSGQSISEDDLRRDPAFVGEEMILGYKTFHIHSPSTVVAGDYTDSYICPALQGHPLKIVAGSRNSKTVFEVTRVILGEPSFTVPDYQVDSTQFEKLQKARAASVAPAEPR
jgi:hypothetical protein